MQRWSGHWLEVVSSLARGGQATGQRWSGHWPEVVVEFAESDMEEDEQNWPAGAVARRAAAKDAAPVMSEEEAAAHNVHLGRMCSKTQKRAATVGCTNYFCYKLN